MNEPRSYWLLFLILLLLCAFAAVVTNRLDGSRPQFLETPGEQQGPIRIQRLLIDGMAGHLSEVVSPTATVCGPARIEAGPAGELFVIDDGDHERIKEFSTAGDLLHAFDGADVPHMESVTDLAIVPGRLWVADLLASSIHTLDRRNGIWNSYKTNIEPYRIETTIDGTERLVIMRIGSRHLFDLTTSRGEFFTSFGALLKDQGYHSLALDGFIIRSGSSIIYSGKHLGVLASFSTTGALNYAVETIDAPENLKVMEKGGRRWLHHGPLLASVSVAGVGDVFSILTERALGGDVRFFVDLYEVSDGNYLRSLLLPGNERWTSVAVSDDYFYAASETAILRWEASVINRDVQEGSVSTGRTFMIFHKKQTRKGDIP